MKIIHTVFVPNSLNVLETLPLRVDSCAKKNNVPVTSSINPAYCSFPLWKGSGSTPESRYYVGTDSVPVNGNK